MIIEVEVDLKEHLFNNANRDNFIKSVEVQLAEVCPTIVKMATEEYDVRTSHSPSLTFTAIKRSTA